MRPPGDDRAKPSKRTVWHITRNKRYCYATSDQGESRTYLLRPPIGNLLCYEQFMNLKKYIHTTKTYVAARSEQFIGIGVVAGLAAIVGIVVLIVQLGGPRIVYQPIKACDLLTPARAQSVLGEKINGVDSNEPKISGDIATSKCAYSDLNADVMKVAAVAIRSGINDEGVAQNTSDFKTAKAQAGNTTVTGFGDGAFFNPRSGQLNVLKDHKWIIVSYGLGSSPQTNSLEEVSALARKVLP